MTSPDAGIVLGVDVGFSKKRRTTSACVLEWHGGKVSFRTGRLPNEPGKRRELLKRIFKDRQAMCVALDGPFRERLDTIGEYRTAEMILTRGLAKHIGKPGQSSSGNGIRLNESTNEIARLLLAEDLVADTAHEARIMDKAIVEAFPTSFMGVMLAKDRVPVHGPRSDAYFEHLLGPDTPRPRPSHVNTLTDLVHRLLPGHHLLGDLADVTDHDNRAAVICALTALCVVTGQYVAAGDRGNGYIILPPKARPGTPGLQAWAWEIIEGNARPLGAEAIIVEPPGDAVRVDPDQSNAKYAIDYMPWANLHSEFSIGPVTFWPFSQMARQKISDNAIRDHLTRCFRCYVDSYGKPVDSLVVCSVGDIDFREPSSEELGLIRSAVDCLIFSAICTGTRSSVSADNNSMAPPTADRFALYSRDFILGRSGFGVRSEGMLNYFTDMDEVRIAKPFAIRGLFDSESDQHLAAFSRVLDGKCSADFRERLFRSLEWFRLAHTMTDIGATTWLNRVVMMCTAFEILLQLPERNQKLEFARRIEAMIATDRFLREKRRDDKGKVHEASRVGFWAKDFYDLRSRIAHGASILPEENRCNEWITQLIVADLLFLECVEILLYHEKCFGDNYRELARKFRDCKSAEDEPDEDEEDFGLHMLKTSSFDSAYRRLGWLPAGRFESEE